MDRLGAMRVFVAVVDAQGFSAASRALRIPLSTVSRKIAELESHIGAQLLTRSTRKVIVTDSGGHYYEDARRILDAVEAAEHQVSGEYQQPKGHLTITAPTLFGRRILLPIANDFMRLHRDITIRFHLTNSVVDLLAEHLNLGIRIGPLADSSMIGTQAGIIREIVCASPRYLSQYGRPLSPSDLARYQCITYARSDAPKEWIFKSATDGIERVPIKARLALDSVEGVVLAAVQDAGVAMMYSYQAAHHIAAGRLEIILKDREIDPLPLSFIYPQDRLVPQKVRAFIDFAMPRLRERLEGIAAQCSQ
ncbi:MAG: LysR family transcriptional regulator [Alphaproteobacteria bacterium]|jgi:DNA-binding transcriptional LysR family regulator